MTYRYQQNTPISKLSVSEPLLTSDAFLVSEYNVNSDSLYYSDQLNYQQMINSLSEDFDFEELERQITKDIIDAGIISDYLTALIDDEHGFEEKFLSNDVLTRNIPKISNDIEQISSRIAVGMHLTKIVNIDPIDGIFDLHNFSHNICNSHTHTSKFRIPELQEGLSRQLIIDLSNQTETVVCLPKQYEYYSKYDMMVLIPPNSHTIYNIKEIENDVFYIQKTDSVLTAYEGEESF